MPLAICWRNPNPARNISKIEQGNATWLTLCCNIWLCCVQAGAPLATAGNNANIRAGLQRGDLGSPLQPDERRASARSYAPDGSRVSVVPSYEGEHHLRLLPLAGSDMSALGVLQQHQLAPPLLPLLCQHVVQACIAGRAATSSFCLF